MVELGKSREKISFWATLCGLWDCLRGYGGMVWAPKIWDAEGVCFVNQFRRRNMNPSHALGAGLIVIARIPVALFA